MDKPGRPKKRKLFREIEHADPDSRKVKIPRAPAYISAAEPPVPVAAYRTSQLRRERFKKPAVCKSAPLGRQHSGPPGPASRQLPEATHSHSATELNRHVHYPVGRNENSGAYREEPMPCIPSFAETDHEQPPQRTLNDSQYSYSQLASDPVISYITSTRLKLGLGTGPTSHPSDPVGGGSLPATSKPMHVAAGIRDLKMLSRRLSSLQAAVEHREQTAEEEGPDPGGFVYCLRKDLGRLNSRYNPYDLRIVSSEKARTLESYYTVSAFTVTELVRNGGMDPTPVPRWLWEREVFQRLLNIPFFALFKLRRSFIVWRKWILSRKMSARKTTLQRDLFSADRLLQTALLHVQQLCEAACSSHHQQVDTGSSAISLLEVAPGTTYTLEDFMAVQERAVGVARAKLADLREAVVGVVLTTCKAVVLKEGVGGLTGEESSGKEPSHTRVLEWRGVLERLERFVRLCGLLVMELLQRLVLRAVGHLERCFRRSVQDTASRFKTQTQQLEAMQQKVLSQPNTQSIWDRGAYLTVEEGEEEGGGGWEGMLQENAFTACMLEPGHTDLPPELRAAAATTTSSSTSLSDGDRVETSSEPDGDPPQDPMEVAALLFRKPPEPVAPLWEAQLLLLRRRNDGGENTCENETKGDPGGERSSGKPPSFCVSFTPSAVDFKSAVSKLLGSYEQTMAGFSPLLTEERLVPYVSRSRYDLLMLLEEESCAKGGGRRRPPWPDTRSLLSEYAPYQASVGYIEGTLQATMAEIERQATHYLCYSKMVEVCSQANIPASTAVEQWSAPTFQRAFAIYHDQVHAMEGMVLELRVGMVRVEVGGFHGACLSHTRAVLSELECRLPQLAHCRVDDLVGRIKRATEQLQTTPTDVESFAQYLDSVEQVKAAVPKMEGEMLTATNLYSVAQEFEVFVPGEEMALYKALFPQFRLLKNLLFQAEATKSEHVHQYTSDLRTLMADIHRQAMELKGHIEAPSLLERGASEQSEPLNELELYKKQLDTLLSQAKSYLEYHRRFGAVPTTRRHYYSLGSPSHSWTPEEVYQEVLGVQQALKLRQGYFQAQGEWAELVQRWSNVPLESLDVNQLQREVNCFVHTVDYLEMGLSSSKTVAALRSDVVSFRSTLPTLSCLLNPELRLRHWEDIRKSTGEDLGGDRSVTTMCTLKQMKIFEHHSEIASISNQASHEATLEKMLKKVSQEWVSKEFMLVAYCGSSGRQTCVLGGVEELLALLDDSLATLSTIRSSKYATPIKHAVLDWMGRLSLVLETVEQWVACQRSWLHLETIFSAADIQRQLSNEARLFLQADKSWREVMRIIADKPTALKAATTPGILEAFQVCNTLLEQVFKTLEDYLETKRLAFPRLYFISNNELLDILAHVKDPSAVQPYLSKLFGNIKRLVLERDVQVSPAVTAMVSAEGEKIELPKGLYARGSPEQWLSGVEKAMVEAVSRLMKTGVTGFDSVARRQWAQEHPGQVVLTAAQIDWTQSVERCLQSASPKEQLKHLLETCLANLEELASLSISTAVPATKQLVLTALLTLDVHGRDVISSLLKKDVSSVNDFDWIRHLRYYWQDDSNLCSLTQCFASFCYGNEYLGCLPRLVLTPLSERCYLTLTTAMKLHLGGSPIGPAGTGKSETVKDLARAVGKLCLVFNCSEGLDYKVMGRFFSGLCQSGVWCCFDEFNRIDVEVLSVVAQQLQSIKSAKDCGTTRFVFECREVKLIPSCAAFITMNPDYAGRVELPDNLQPLFRPVAMVVPDTAMIVEVLLFTCGFTMAPVLATKLTKLYEMATVQLSQEIHYDFGLRAVKSIVVLAGEFLQKEMRRAVMLTYRSGISSDPEGRERGSLLHALRESTLPRLVSKDVQAMEMLIYDFFAGFEKAKNYTINTLKGYLESSAVEMFLQPSPSQLDKCLHFYSTLMVRHGVMLLGPTGGGKSTVLKLLKMALNKAHGDFYGEKTLGDISPSESFSLAGSIRESLRFSSAHHCQVQTINPKCLSLSELYGHYDPLSLEWRSGVLARTLQLFFHQCEAATRAARERDCKEATKKETNIGESTECSSVASSALLSELGAEENEVGHAPWQDHNSPPSLQGNVQETHTSGLPYPSCAPVGWRWVILDGPVDPEWVENLNTTLDDSKLLCLANGERVELQPGMRVLIETDNLLNASPATVSRCGIIYMDPSDLGWKSQVLTWIKSVPSDLPRKGTKHLLSLFSQSMDEGLRFLKEHSSSLSCPVPGSSAVATLCHILSVFLDYISTECGGFSPPKPKAVKENSSTLAAMNVSTKQQPQQHLSLYSISLARKSSKLWQKRASLISQTTPFLHRHPEALCELLGKLFVFAFTWSFGGCFESVGSEEEIDSLRSEQNITRGGLSIHSKFDALVHKVFSSPSELEVKLPLTADLIYSYYVNLDNCSFVLWDKLVPSSKEIVTKSSLMQKGFQSLISSSSTTLIDTTAPIGTLHMATEVGFVPTVDTVRLLFFSQLLQKAGYNVLLSGKLGVGKTSLLTQLAKMTQSVEQDDNILSSVLGGGTQSSRTIQPALTSVEENQDNVVSMHISSQTTASHLQSAIEGSLVIKSKSTLAPPAGKKLVVCLDDLNMASPDAYGSQPCSELLRQLSDGRGWYDRKNLTWKEIRKVTILATAGKRGWGYYTVNQRCLNKFSMFCIPDASTATLMHIFSTHITKAFATSRLSPEVTESISQLISTAIHLYHEIRSQLLPSPLKPQYTFCTRDLAKTFTGLLRVTTRGPHSRKEATHLLCHELMRVFHDRCLPADREHFLHTLSEALKIHMKVFHTPSQIREQLFLCESFTDPSRGYSAIKNPKKLVKHFERMQSQYNIAKDKNSHLVFFPLACEHICRVTRVLQQPGGHLLLLGMGGIGKRSTVELASYIAGCEYHQLALGPTQGRASSFVSQYKEDLKALLTECGVKDQPSVLVVPETVGEQDSLFHDIHELLVCGEVTGLFEREEVEGIASQLAEGRAKEEEELGPWEVFVKRVRSHLHLVLCFSPSSPFLAQLCHRFPGLVTHTTVDVFDEWPAKALYGVALKEIHSQEIAHSEIAAILKELQQQVASTCVKIHGSVVSAAQRAVDELAHSFPVTPSAFIHFVQSFCRKLHQRYQKITSDCSYLEAGLHHLGEANERVEVMRGELEVLRPEIQQKAEEAELLLQQLMTEQQDVDTLREAVEKEREEIAWETEYVAKLAEEAEADLRKVLPALEEAERGLNALKKADLLEIRSYATPPSMVMHVMSAVCVLLQQPPDWATVKHLMADPITFLKRLTSFDQDNIPDKVLSKLRRYTRNPNFLPEKVAHFSVACQSFCQWVLATQHYGEVYRVVQPKRQLHHKVTLRLRTVQSKLKGKEAQLEELQTQLSALQEQHSVKVNEREALQVKSELVSAQLTRAEVLTNSLADEQIRWYKTLTSLQSHHTSLVGDALLSTACLVYAGPFSPSLRQPLLGKWRHLCQEARLPPSQGFSMETGLVESDQVQEWHAQCLPKDAHSVQNAIIVTQSERWPLIIDPQGQATRWLKAMLGARGSSLMVISHRSTQLTKVLEEAVMAGLPVIVEDVPDRLDSLLEPFLFRPTASSQGQLLLSVGKTQLEYNPAFRLFLVSQQSELQLTSDLSTRTSVVNFSATLEGLQDQLLSVVVSLEEPSLESQYSELLLSTAGDQRQLKALEHKLLNMLRNISGSILEDEELVQALQEAKRVAVEVEERLAQAQEAQEEVATTRHHYQPIATRGSLLYFSLLSLKFLSSMYQFSLSQFQTTFSKCIQDIEASSTGVKASEKYGSDFREYVTNVIQHLTKSVYSSTSLALSTEHSLPFSLKLCCSILMHGDEVLGIAPTISRAEWLTFVQKLHSVGSDVLKHGLAQRVGSSNPAYAKKTPSGHHRRHATPSKQQKVKRPEFLSQEVWEACLNLENLLPDCFSGLSHHIVQNNKLWETFEVTQSWEHFSDVSSEENRKLTIANTDIVLIQQPDTGDHLQVISSKSSEPTSSRRSSVSTSSCVSQKKSRKSSDPASSHSSRKSSALTKTSVSPKYHKTSEPVGISKARKTAESSFHPSTLSPFQQLLLKKVFHPEQLTSAVKEFIQQQLDATYISKPLLDLGKVYRESNSLTPILFILAPGTDPTTSLQQLSSCVTGGPIAVDSVSLGQGQGGRARELVQFGAQQGRWVFLQNCHLAASWMPQLEEVIQSLEDTHHNFRLWLSSKPTPAFPTTVLQSSIKVSLEPPRSMKASLQQLLSGSGTPVVGRDTFESDSCGDFWRQLLFGLCLFHMAANGRKVYGTRGWNLPHSFSHTDLQVTVQLLHSLLSESPGLSWAAVHRLTSRICYGGRVTDPWDLCCLEALLGRFCGPETQQEGHCYVGSSQVYGPLPPSTSYSECCLLVERLPPDNPPEVCGLPPSLEAELGASESRELQEMLHTLLFPAQGQSMNYRLHDELVLEKATNLLEQLPPSLQLPSLSPSDTDPTKDSSGVSTPRDSPVPTPAPTLAGPSPPSQAEQADEGSKRQKCPSPFWLLLVQEVSQWNSRVGVVSSSLGRLAAAVKGEVPLLEETEAIYQALVADVVPGAWQLDGPAGADESLSLSKWFHLLLERHRFLAHWASLNTGQRSIDWLQEPKLPPTGFWLAALSSPKGLLAAVVQDFSRRARVAPERAELKFQVLDSDSTAAKGGIILRGLWLEGAQWSTRGELTEQSGVQSLTALPDVLCYPTTVKESDQNSSVKAPCHYLCPLYSSPSRRHLITSLPLATSRQPDHWALHGVALLAHADHL